MRDEGEVEGLREIVEKNMGLFSDAGSCSSSRGGGFRSDQILCRRGVGSVRDVDPVPSSWKRDERTNLEISNMSLRATYNGQGKSETDAAAVLTDYPIPTNSCAFYYFEVEIINAGQSGYIGIGLSGADVKMDRLPGWEKNSYGYHGDDGCAFLGSGQGTPYGPSYTTNDVVGCCWDMTRDIVFFTKNGMALGTAFEAVRGSYFPTIGLRTVGEVVEANFGQRPFVFDIEAFIREEKMKFIDSITSMDLVRRFDLMTGIVLEHMIHHGYAESATIFAKYTGRERKVELEVTRTLQRQKVCRFVLDGHIDEALQEAEELFPGLLKNERDVVFVLRCQKFIELMRNSSPSEAVTYAQRELAEFQYFGDEYNKTLTNILALLAYENPHDSPVAYLLDPKRRFTVAEALNGAILGAQKQPRESIFTRMVAHGTVLLEDIASLSNGPAALFSTEDFL